jgi:hypothetical protein
MICPSVCRHGNPVERNVAKEMGQALDRVAGTGHGTRAHTIAPAGGAIGFAVRISRLRQVSRETRPGVFESTAQAATTASLLSIRSTCRRDVAQPFAAVCVVGLV